MASKVKYNYTPEGIPVNPYNNARPPKGLRIDKAEMKVPTGCNSKIHTATSLCVRSVGNLEEDLLRMIPECDALAALLICLLTPIIEAKGGKVSKWKKVESKYNGLPTSVTHNDCNPSAAELREAFDSKNFCELTVKAAYQVSHWIRPAVFDEDDEPLSGTRLQFSHFYYGMEDDQRYVVYRLFSVIKKDVKREGAQWLDRKPPVKASRRIRKAKLSDRIRALLATYARNLGVYQDLVTTAHTAALSASSTHPMSRVELAEISEPNAHMTSSPNGRRGVVTLRTKTSNGKSALRALLSRVKATSQRKGLKPQATLGVRDLALNSHSAFSSTETLDRIPEDVGQRQGLLPSNEKLADQEGAKPLEPQTRRKEEARSQVPVDVFHPIMEFTRFLPILRTWDEPGVQSLQSAFDRVENSGVPGLAEHLQATNATRKRCVDGDGLDDVLEIQKFFSDLCNRLRVWVNYSRVAKQTSEHQKVAQEIMDCYNEYVEVHAET